MEATLQTHISELMQKNLHGDHIQPLKFKYANRLKGRKRFHFCAGPFWNLELYPSPQEKLKVREKMKADTPVPQDKLKAVGPLFRGSIS